ncbi:MAG: hypothetical protein H2172_07405 [Opitutus sp.]|nr:hypothetical protein [Opitutus sp.]MCS6246591.1 hypothetical protein [Opitutus sp.]MCS6274582.1 hypothetical protein [Opitutus sp.]MCS6276061.1 hypothetical protein [Opitutus sp.]MCS6301157.1 hypothetical protein [Opitutus sp.]
MNDTNNPEIEVTTKKPRGYFPPQVIKSISFIIISFCIVASVVVCILAIWDFAKQDALWRLVSSFGVVGIGTALFAKVNGMYGE